jgi:hypothetical protein
MLIIPASEEAIISEIRHTKKDKTLKQLSQDIGISLSTLYRVRIGNRLSGNIKIKILKFYLSLKLGNKNVSAHAKSRTKNYYS